MGRKLPKIQAKSNSNENASTEVLTRGELVPLNSLQLAVYGNHQSLLTADQIRHQPPASE
jgi:hypothetical protein